MFDDVIHALVELTNNKLVSAVVPVLLGAGLLAWWFKLRDRRLAIRDESLKFVNETADLLNSALSPLFGVIRYRSLKHLHVVDEGISDQFRHRLGTRARSLALLHSPEFGASATKLLGNCVKSSTNFVRQLGRIRLMVRLATTTCTPALIGSSFSPREKVFGRLLPGSLKLELTAPFAGNVQGFLRASRDRPN